MVSLAWRMRADSVGLRYCSAHLSTQHGSNIICTCNARRVTGGPVFAYAKTKAQISCEVTAQLSGAFFSRFHS